MTSVELRIVGASSVLLPGGEIQPDAPNLFALLLYLSLEAGKAIPRRQLSELLLAEPADDAQLSHNLRQLVYRARIKGAPITARGTVLELAPTSVGDPLSELRAASRTIRAQRPAHAFEILPAYEPSLSPQLRDWLSGVRARLEEQVRHLLLEDLEHLRRGDEWDIIVPLATTLTRLDPCLEVPAMRLAEALAMRGESSRALLAIDRYVATVAGDLPVSDSMAALRKRVSRARVSRQPVLPRFVGRRDQLQQLNRLWTEATELHPRICVVTGAPGVGKTRLSTEFLRQAVTSGGQTVVHRCESTDAGQPLSLFTHILTRLRSLRGSLGSSPALRVHLDTIALGGLGIASLEPAAAEALRRDLHLSLIDLVDAVAAEKPLLIVIDDAQHIDDSSWRLLQQLCSRSSTSALLILCCTRHFPSPRLRLRADVGLSVVPLPPLTLEDTADLLHDILGSYFGDDAFVEWCAAQAAGNPFYLCMLARHAHGLQKSAIPVDVRSLASASYYHLSVDARCLLESCIYLAPFASLKRVQEVAGIAGRSLLAALRELEEEGLIALSSGQLRCSHGILEEAIKSIVPESIALLRYRQAAECLTKACASDLELSTLARGAAEKWMGAGEIAEAVSLLINCAERIARMGEPLLAAHTLQPLLSYDVPPPMRRQLLDHIIRFAEVSGDCEIPSACSAARIIVARQMGATHAELCRLQLHLIETRFVQGEQPEDLLSDLEALCVDKAATLSTRLGAGLRRLIIADLLLDESLGKEAFCRMVPLLEQLPSNDSLRQRIPIVYETVFGLPARAVELIRALLLDYPVPTLSQAACDARRHASFALSRLGWCEEAKQLLIATYHFMTEHHVSRESFYASALLGEVAVARGDFAEATGWLRAASPTSGSRGASGQFAAIGQVSTAAEIAIAEGHAENALALVAAARTRHDALSSPRLAAILLSIEVRAEIAGGRLSSQRVSELLRLYALGRSLGGQDPIVAALCSAHRWEGRTVEAQALVGAYLDGQRRESTPLEWSLQASIASLSGA